jgi:hypothetical protein
VSTFSILGFTIPLTSKLTVDLDLKVFDSAGNQVGYSGSYDNSYQIAEFVGSPGQGYTIRIRRLVWNGPGLLRNCLDSYGRYRSFDNRLGCQWQSDRRSHSAR